MHYYIIDIDGTICAIKTQESMKIIKEKATNADIALRMKAIN